MLGRYVFVAVLTLSSVTAWASPATQPQRASERLTNRPSEMLGNAIARRPGPSANCRNDSDCDDAIFCNGQETCVQGDCHDGTPVNCDDGIACTTDLCNENQNSCSHLPNDGICDNGTYCDGEEYCDPAWGCESEPVQCPTGEFCSETLDDCVQCEGDEDCDDGNFCNGAEICGSDYQCEAAADPCAFDEFCSEPLGACVECLTNTDCSDGVFCNGAEVCGSDGFCASGSPPCSGSSFCNESQDECVECFDASDCDDGQFCNGAETCNNGSCVAGSSPCDATETCNESQNTCESNAGDEPTAEFVMSSNPIEIGDELTLSAMAPPADVLYYMWEISGPRACVDCMGEDVTVVYPEAGSYTATLMILFMDGGYLSSTQTFEVVHGLELVGMIDGIIGDVKDVTISASSQTAWMISDPARVVGVDIANPAEPTLAWDLSDDIVGAVMDMDSDGNTVAVAASWGGAYLIDMESDGSAVTINHIDTWADNESKVWGVAIFNDTLILATSNTTTGQAWLKSYDITNRSNPVLLSSQVPTGSFIKGFHRDGNRLYARDEARPSVVVFDVSDPGYPEQIGIVHTPYFARDIDVQDNLLAVTAAPVELALYDVSNLSNPVQLSEYSAGLSPRGIALMDDKVYLGRAMAVYEFSIADPYAPVILENIQPFAGTGYNKAIKGMAIHNGMIFAPFAQGGLSVVSP